MPSLLAVIEQKYTESLNLASLNTGAYHDLHSGYGGNKHCNIPSPPNHILM